MKTEQGEKVKELPKEIKKHGSTATQLKRIGDVAMYKFNDTNYEVIIVQHSNSKTLNGYFYPAMEQMPPSSSWGVLGYTFMSLENAEIKFNELIGEVKPIKTKSDFHKMMDYYFNSNAWL